MKIQDSFVTAVTTEEFPKVVVGSSVPVVVDFWAAWCGPCRQMSSVLETLAHEYAGRVAVAKVNVDEEPGLALSFGIQGIPSLIYYEAGAPREMITGMRSAGGLRQWIDRHLAA